MEKWSFPSKNYGEIEGYANPGMEMFKGNPLQALTREICQNSLDAEDGDKTVLVEFEKYEVNLNDFPGMLEMGKIIQSCYEFWGENANVKTQMFLDDAMEVINSGKIIVLRISDYNTVGLSGAYAKGKEITPWIKLVKGNAISTKDGDSAGSYGIGKAAAFVNSSFQTVFYRTVSKTGEVAAQGVARLMSFEDKDVKNEDPIRRAIGYYGNPVDNMPVDKIMKLDEINKRDTPGTDLFIPGFTGFTKDGIWVSKMICEILDNFLMSIYNEKLVVKIHEKEINKQRLNYLIAQNEKGAKDAYCYNKILVAQNDKVIEDYYDFHGMGKLHLRLLYDVNLNKKVLVVRKSGMKISEIPGLPKSISYTGILELEGYELNAFFREMENPQHNRWEPNRHPKKELAKLYKSEAEEWVRNKIYDNIENMAGTEIDVDTGNLFGLHNDIDEFGDKQVKENIYDSVKSIDVAIVEKKSRTIKKLGLSGDIKLKGKVDEFGNDSAIRSHVGEKGIKPGKPRGRIDNEGNDHVKKGMRSINAKVRAMVSVNGYYRLIIEADREVVNGQVEVISSGENGKGSLLRLSDAKSEGKSLEIKDGKILIGNIKEGERREITFEISDIKKYSLGVKLYGN